MGHNTDYQPKQSSQGESSNIYGSDDNAFADKCSAGALIPTPGSAGTNISDYWGDTKDATAKSKGNTDAREMRDDKIIRKEEAGGGDKEALDDSTGGGQRHRRGPGSWGGK